MHHLIGRAAAAVILAGAAAISVPGAVRAQEATVIATVNGHTITEADVTLAEGDLDPQFEQLPQDQRRAAAVSAIIEIKLAATAAEQAGVADDPEFQRRMDFLRDRALHSEFVKDRVANAVTDEAVRARYDAEIASAPVTNEVRASHILVKTEDEARDIIRQLGEGADFGELAKQHSSDGSAQNGGDLGFFGPGRMVPEFESAAFALDVGGYSQEPVKSQFGFHVIKLTDKRPQQPPAFEQVERQIRSILLREKYFAEIAELRKAADVEISDPALKAAVEAVDGQ
ncbi:MAG: peptidylprolyl isomerase [Rhizobiaceae bacterium]|nr:peptidylprolyl isomerase [Rhizobiaceae bacterium]